MRKYRKLIFLILCLKMFIFSGTFLLFLCALMIANIKMESLPNILVVLTDDQDVELHGMFPMRAVKSLIGDAGATFENAFTSSPLCCPSRSSLLSGMYSHNHRTFNNSASGGCNGAHWQTEIEPHALPVALQNKGYDTFFAGKYLNQFHGSKVPCGWTFFNGLHGNSVYYNYTMLENSKNVSYTDVYLTDLLKNQTVEFVDTHANSSRPFFIYIAPPAPHAPFVPANRHRNKFKGIRALRTPNFNHVSENLGLFETQNLNSNKKNIPTEKHWLVSSFSQIPDKTLDIMDMYFQHRWEALLAVDEMIEEVLRKLKDQNLLENTYIVYTSDNGYHVGQFAQPFDKRQPYETDIRVPLLIRGPSVPKGLKVSAPALLLDLMPTILEWAKLPAPSNMDGQSLNEFLSFSDYDPLYDRSFQRSLLVQHWGEGTFSTFNPDCPWHREDRLSQCTLSADCHCQDAWNNTFACIRHFGYNTDRIYCEFSDNEKFIEAYDLNEDPYQMSNLGYNLLPIERALYSIALANLTHCIGISCKIIKI